jgi:hypothetical protein
MALLLEKSIHIYQIKKKDDFYQLEYEIFFLEKKNHSNSIIFPAVYS